MARPNFAKAIFTALGIVVMLVWLIEIFGAKTITNSSITFAVVINRNGQEVTSNQIRSVRYLFEGQPSHSAQEIKIDRLREATALHDDTGKFVAWDIHAMFNLERTSMYPFGSARIAPSFRSVFLQVEFSDGENFSVSFPIFPGQHESGAVYLNFNDALP